MNEPYCEVFPKYDCISLGNTVALIFRVFLSGLMNKLPSLHSSTSDSALPGICKDLIGSAVSRLRSCRSAEENESLADKLTLDLLAVHGAVRSIADLYEHLDDDSQENRTF